MQVGIDLACPKGFGSGTRSGHRRAPGRVRTTGLQHNGMHGLRRRRGGVHLVHQSCRSRQRIPRRRKRSTQYSQSRSEQPHVPAYTCVCAQSATCTLT